MPYLISFIYAHCGCMDCVNAFLVRSSFSLPDWHLEMIICRILYQLSCAANGKLVTVIQVYSASLLGEGEHLGAWLCPLHPKATLSNTFKIVQQLQDKFCAPSMCLWSLCIKIGAKPEYQRNQHRENSTWNKMSQYREKFGLYHWLLFLKLLSLTWRAHNRN